MPDVRPAAFDRSRDERSVLEIRTLLDSLAASRSAEQFNSAFACDVLWGSPRGGFLDSFGAVHSVHKGFFDREGGPTSSRFSLQQIRFCRRDVAVAQVLRHTLDGSSRVVPDTSDPSAFVHEAVLLVFVRKDGKWWLAAGQNTPVRPAGFRFQDRPSAG